MIANYKTQDSYYSLSFNSSKNNKKSSSLIRNLLKQKISGILMLVIGILIPIWFDGDATISLFAIPLGIYLLFTKKHIIGSIGGI